MRRGGEITRIFVAPSGDYHQCYRSDREQNYEDATAPDAGRPGGGRAHVQRFPWRCERSPDHRSAPIVTPASAPAPREARQKQRFNASPPQRYGKSSFGARPLRGGFSSGRGGGGGHQSMLRHVRGSVQSPPSSSSMSTSYRAVPMQRPSIRR